MMEKQVIESIKKLAIEFINANWNVPYGGYDTLLEWIKRFSDELNPKITLNQYVKLIKADDTLHEAGWIIQGIAIADNKKFGFLNSKIAYKENGDCADTPLIKFTFKEKNDKDQDVYNTRYFDIYEGGYTEYIKKQKTIEVWEEVQ